MNKDLNKMIRNTKKHPKEMRAKIIYEHLVKGLSTRQIERNLLNVNNDGWTSWEILQVYGFDKSTKGTKPNYTLNEIIEGIEDLDLNDFEKFLKDANDSELNIPITLYTEKDGTDVFYRIRVRIGQAKWRKHLMENYNFKCALCDISESSLLIASHIKSWADSNRQEKVSNENGIILCALHDRMFDKGLISLSDDYTVLYSKKINFEYQGLSRKLRFKKPKCNPPNLDLLKYHRKNVFEK